MSDVQTSTDMSAHREYVFHKPLWRRLLPVFVLVALWGVPLFLSYATTTQGEGLAESLIRLLGHWLVGVGVTIKRTMWLAGFLSLPVLWWWLSGFEKIVITPSAFTRVSLFGNRRSFRWTDLDEVLIEHVEAHLEGKATMRKILTLYAVRRRFTPWRKRMRISNRQFEGYHHVERIASEVAIPAIASRYRAEIRANGKAAKFAERNPVDDIRVVVLAITGVALIAAWGMNSIWKADYAMARPYVLGVAVLLEIVALRKFLFRQVGIDQNFVYVMRRDWVTKKIPIDRIADVRVRDNRMRILVKTKGEGRPKTAFKTKRFIRNRGVLLRLIREAHEARQLEDATPIVPVHAIQPKDEVPDTHVGSGGAA